MNHLVCMVWGGPSAGTERARLGPFWVVESNVEPQLPCSPIGINREVSNHVLKRPPQKLAPQARRWSFT